VPWPSDDSPYESSVRNWCEAAYEEAEYDQQQSEELQKVVPLQKYLAGKQWQVPRASYKAKPVNNRMFRLFWELVGQLTDIRPVISVGTTHTNDESKKIADGLTKGIRAWSINENFDRTLAMCACYGLLTTAFAKVQFNPDLNMGLGEIEILPLPGDAVLPLKPNPLNLYQSEALIYKRVVPLGWLRRKYGARAESVRPDPEYSKYQVQNSPPSNISPMMFKMLGDSMRRVLAGDPKMVNSAVPMCLYREFWIKDYCVSPSTRILTADLQWKRADSIKVGDELVGCDEEAKPSPNSKAKSGKTVNVRWLKKTVVESIKTLRQPCVRVTTDKGVVICSTRHRWLVKTAQAGNRSKAGWWKHYDWRMTEDINPGDQVAFLCPTWEEDNTKEAGYLAGVFDGEGWCAKYAIGFAQKEGTVSHRTTALLEERGFKVYEHRSNSTANQFVIKGGRGENLRFLGSIRPLRLLEKANQMWEGKLLQCKGMESATVISCEPIGEQEVLAIQTSEKTFIAEGFVSHNSSNTSNINVRMGRGNWSYIVKPGQPLYPRGRLIVMGGHKIVDDVPNPYWHGRPPFAMLRMNVVPWQFYGMSPLLPLMDLQDIINQILAGVLDLVKKTLNPPLIAPKNAFPESVWNSMDFSQPNARVFYNQQSAHEPKYGPVPSLPSMLLPLMQGIEREMDQQSTGALATEAARKKQMPGADAIESLKAEKQTPVRLQGRNIEMFIQDLGQMMVPNMFQFWDTKKRIQVLGVDSITSIDFDWNPGNLIPAGEDPMETVRRYSFLIQQGSLLNIKRVEEQAQLLGLRKMREISRKTFFKMANININADEEATLLKQEMAEMPPPPQKKGGK